MAYIHFTLKYFRNEGKATKLIYEKNSDCTSVPFICDLLDVDSVDSSKILSICTGLLADALPSVFSLLISY